MTSADQVQCMEGDYLSTAEYYSGMEMKQQHYHAEVTHVHECYSV